MSHRLLALKSDEAHDLVKAQRDLRLPQDISKLDRFELSNLDDVSHVRRGQAESSVPFELLAACIRPQLAMGALAAMHPCVWRRRT